MSSETISLIMTAAAKFGEYLFNAFTKDDDEELKKLTEVLPSELRTKIALKHQEEVAKKMFGE